MTADDLVDGSGRCAGVFVARPATERWPNHAQPPVTAPGAPMSVVPAAVAIPSEPVNVPVQGAPVQEPVAPAAPAAIALEMTECDVVKRLGSATTCDRRQRARRAHRHLDLYPRSAARHLSLCRRPAEINGAGTRPPPEPKPEKKRQTRSKRTPPKRSDHPCHCRLQGGPGREPFLFGLRQCGGVAGPGLGERGSLRRDRARTTRHRQVQHRAAAISRVSRLISASASAMR